MKVILAGMPKTGTKTISRALQILGYSVYDAADNFNMLRNEWTRIMRVGSCPDDFLRMYGAVDATCDVPACYYWEEMHKAFPDAKIVLMVRDSDEEWYRSMERQLRLLSTCGLYSVWSQLSPHCSRLQSFLNDSLRTAFGSLPITPWREYTPNEQSLKIAYRNHNARVQQVAPKDKLLVYRCVEGWPALCSFLGCQVPDEKFPHRNKRGEILRESMTSSNPGYRRIRREMALAACALSCMGLYAFYWLVRRAYSRCV